MNNIKLVCNKTIISKTPRHQERISIDELEARCYNMRLYRGSLIIEYNYLRFGIIKYEVVESDPEMEPEQLFNLWRLMYG